MSYDRPMREPTYYILAALLDGPLHGYAIIKRAEELSEGRVRPAAGTLYAALDRLASEGLAETVREETVNGRARRYYALTRDGAAALRAQARRMARAADLVIEHRVIEHRAPASGGSRMRGTGAAVTPA
jgi:DNA-binding PadR family transcriptional regulator